MASGIEMKNKNKKEYERLDNEDDISVESVREEPGKPFNVTMNRFNSSDSANAHKKHKEAKKEKYALLSHEEKYRRIKDFHPTPITDFPHRPYKTIFLVSN